MVGMLLLGAAACGGADTDQAQNAGVSTETTTQGLDQSATTTSVVDQPSTSTPRTIGVTRVTATTPTSNPSGYEPPTPPVTAPLPTFVEPPPTHPYLPGGPVDQIFPPGTKAYELLADGDCGPLLRQIEQGEPPEGETEPTPVWAGNVPAEATLLYRAAANACLSRWGVAKTQFLQVLLPLDCGFVDAEPPVASLFETKEECLAIRMPVYRWTEALLAAHTADPQFVPKFNPPPTP